ncbi:MFS transporter [Pandoraea terrae]|uniref:MFS transporter n=1 Tax=Pandoraea terrae TaxID=1537710 RepID=UPI001CD4299B|nr:MFS transporter [Pandoraea terrae]
MEPATGNFSVAPAVPRTYAWVVFALTFGLLLSDYMSRQVLNAVFPLLKSAWGLSDTRLGSLSGVVALIVGLLTFPLSVIADRWGRVRGIVAMAAVWSLATLGCALATNFGEMLVARAFVGLGEAAYGSVGVALILSIFPMHLRSTLTAAFMAGGAFGSVLGMSLGGVVAVHLGWRWSFGTMALLGILLTAAFWLVVTEKRICSDHRNAHERRPNGQGVCSSLRMLVAGLFSTISVVCAYVGSGLQLFILGSLFVWMPSFLNRYYGLAPDKAGAGAAMFVMIGAVGMVLCGIVTDRVSQTVPARKWGTAIAYCLISFTLLLIGFHVKPGALQLVLIGVGMLVVAGTSGPAGAMVANLTPSTIHASAFATLTLANNLLGLAPGPFVTGVVADRVGLLGALQWIPLMALLAAVAFAIGRSNYSNDLRRLDALRRAAKKS